MPRVARLTDHRTAFDRSCRILRGLYGLAWKGVPVTDPRKVICVLHEANVRFVVIGNYGLVGFRDEPQATQPIEILVAKGDKNQAKNALHQAFPRLKTANEDIGIAFLDSAIDFEVIRLVEGRGRLYSLVFRNSIRADETLRVPTLEMTLVLSFFKMRSKDRDLASRYYGAADFVNVADTQKDVIDEPKVRRIANGIKPGIGTKIVAAIRDVRTGKELRIVP